MSTSKLKPNAAKTDFNVFGSKRKSVKLKAYFPNTIWSSLVCPVESVKNLGVWFDSDFSLPKHFQNVCKSFFVQLHDFRHVRLFLSYDASVLAANALVSSRLDYCNSLFRSLPLSSIFINYSASSAAAIVSITSRYASTTPVEHCSVFKTANPVFKFLHTGFAKYFCSICLFIQQFLQYQAESEWW